VLPLLVHGLFLFRCGARRGALLPWHAVGAPVWPRPPLGRRSSDAFSCSLSRCSHRWGGKGKPQRGWWRWATGSLPPSSLLNPGAARGGRNLYAAPAWTARAPVAAPPPLSARVRSQGIGRGGKRGFSPPGPGSIRARARPVPRRAGRLAGKAIPSRVSPCAVWLG
jgi:hypothetical protein